MDREHYTSLDDISQSESLPLDLYYIENHPSTVGSGSLKSYDAKEGGGTVYARHRSGYSVTVERLLWVDGWEETTIISQGKTCHGQEMTLVVLKVVFASNDAKRKFSRAQVTVTFEDPEKGGENEPTVVAWAPFRKSERWNASQARFTKADKKDGHASVGYSGVEASGGCSQENTISWDQVAFDQGNAHAQISDTTQHRNGVTWSLQQNNLENAGVSPEFWATVLLSRPTAEPYLVKFHVDANVGTMEDFANKTRSFFGSNPYKTKPFLVTPWKSVVCNYEGKDIRKCIDINNLGRLVGQTTSTQLIVKWGPDHQIEVPMPSASRQAWAKEKMAEAETETKTEGLANNNNNNNNNNNKAAEQDASPTSFSTASPAAASTQKPDDVSPFSDTAASPAPAQVSQPSLPPLVIGWQSTFPHSSTTNVEPTRVTDLESRMAQLEARIAGQDVIIMQLQHALLNQKA